MGTTHGVWATAVSGWLTYLAAQGHRPQTRYTRRQHVEHAARRLDVGPWEVTGEHLVAYVARQTWARETLRAHRASLRSFYAWAVQVGHVAVSPALALPKVKASPPSPRPAPDSVYVPALVEATPRERLMLRLAAEHGLRRGEVALVHSRDVVDDLVGWTLVVHGKGGRERTVPLLDDVARELRALPAGWAFPGRLDGHLSPRWIGRLITTLLPGDWTMHKLRHRAATKWWEVDHDLLTVAELLGHASTATTQRYVLTGRDRLRRMVIAGAQSPAA